MQNNNSPFSLWRFKCKMDRNCLSHLVLHVDSNEDPHQLGLSPKSTATYRWTFGVCLQKRLQSETLYASRRIEHTGNKLLFGQLLARVGPDTSPNNHPINDTFSFRNQNVYPWQLQLSFLPSIVFSGGFCSLVTRIRQPYISKIISLFLLSNPLPPSQMTVC